MVISGCSMVRVASDMPGLFISMSYYRNSELSVNLLERALLEATREANETTRPEDIHDLPGTYKLSLFFPAIFLFQLFRNATPYLYSTSI